MKLPKVPFERSQSLLQRTLLCRNTSLYRGESQQSRVGACNMQLCRVSRVLCSLQLSGRGDEPYQQALYLSCGFSAFAADRGPEIPLLKLEAKLPLTSLAQEMQQTLNPQTFRHFFCLRTAETAFYKPAFSE